MCLTLVLSVIAAISLAVLVVLAAKKNKRDALAIIFSAIAIVASFVALAVAAPRDIEPNKLGFDYLGVIVAILAVFATLLLGMQLYHVFRVKEDADKVEEAKAQIEGYAQKVEQIEEKIKQLNEQTSSLKEDIGCLNDIASDLMEKSERAVYFSEDGPDDDK